MTAKQKLLEPIHPGEIIKRTAIYLMTALTLTAGLMITRYCRYGDEELICQAVRSKDTKPELFVRGNTSKRG